MFTDEQKIAIERVREYLKEELSTINRETQEAERAAREYYQAMGPKINCGEKQVDMREKVAAMASVDAGSYDAAKAIASELLERGEQLPERLAGFTAKVLRGEIERPTPGKNKRLNGDLRNRVLAFSVWMLERSGIAPTKASESARKSGCDIVAGIYDELLAHDAEGVITKPRGGEFTGATMRDIWLKDREVLNQREWLSVLPE